MGKFECNIFLTGHCQFTLKSFLLFFSLPPPPFLSFLSIFLSLFLFFKMEVVPGTRWLRCWQANHCGQWHAGHLGLMMSCWFHLLLMGDKQLSLAQPWHDFATSPAHGGGWGVWSWAWPLFGPWTPMPALVQLEIAQLTCWGTGWIAQGQPPERPWMFLDSSVLNLFSWQMYK